MQCPTSAHTSACPSWARQLSSRCVGEVWGCCTQCRCTVLQRTDIGVAASLALESHHSSQPVVLCWLTRDLTHNVHVHVHVWRCVCVTPPPPCQGSVTPDKCVVCPAHGTAFDLATGEVKGEWCPKVRRGMLGWWRLCGSWLASLIVCGGTLGSSREVCHASMHSSLCQASHFLRPSAADD